MTVRPSRSFPAAARAALAAALLLAAFAGQARLVVMHGYADVTSALVWIQAPAPGPILVAWRPEGAERERTLELHANAENDSIVVARLGGLAPGRTAHYRIDGAGERREGAVRAQALVEDAKDAPPVTIAIGSCYFLNDGDGVRRGDLTFGGGDEIFDAIADKRPDVMLWLGDNVYLRRQEYHDPEAMALRYRRQRAHPPLQRLLTTTTHLAIWDDHDYGPNNADGSFTLKGETLRLFRRYWANPGYGLPETPGIFGVASAADVDFILLDGRYHRSQPRLPDGPDKSMFGAAQFAWLKATLLNAQGSVRLVANGSQFWNAASRFEGLYQFPTEQTALHEFLLAQRVPGLLFLSGDRHFTELLRIERPGAYPLYEFTSSPLTSRPWERPDARERDNPQVVPGTLVGRRQFGLIRVTGPGNDRQIALESYDASGTLLWRHELRARPRVPPAEAGGVTRARSGRRGVSDAPVSRAPGSGASRAGALVWFRRDLRDHDHAALAEALAAGGPVYCAFVFDREILDALPSPHDRRVEFIHGSLHELDAALRARGGGLAVRHAFARDEIPRLADALNVAAVYANRDDEPAALDRDAAVAHALADRGVAFRTAKDHVVFARDEVLSKAGTPFTVYTPYRNAWLAKLSPADLAPHGTKASPGALTPPPAALDRGVPALDAMGFATTNLRELGVAPGMRGARERFDQFLGRIGRYGETRDHPGVKGVSYLSVHLRFGTISIRTLAAEAHARALQPNGEGAAKWLAELIWREFYSQLLWHFPHVVTGAFRREYDALAFRNDAAHFVAWCEGRTGYPLVDAGMRQLNATGYMHNRLRMVAASFLVKDLLVDWRWGERVFAERLIDYDLASNNGGWQWAASTGCDAQPWFRIFNPVTQSERYDRDGSFIRRYVPEVAALDAREIHAPWRVPPALQVAKGVVVGRDYPAPIVEHAVARAEALAMYRKAGRGVGGKGRGP